MITEFISYLVNNKGYSLNTAKQYENSLRHFAKANKGRHWSNIEQKDIEAYLVNKKQEGASANTIIANISAIRGIFNWMVIKFQLVDNPAKYIQSPKKNKIIPHVINPDDIIEAVKNEQNMDVKLAIMLMASSGLRVSEARFLKVENIDFRSGETLVMGKGNKERYIYLPSFILEMIKRMSKVRGYIFEGWEDRNFRFAIYSAFHRNGVYASPHQLRHSFASMAINKGMRLDVLREILGHSSIATTQIYLHTSSSVTRAEYNKIFN